MGIYWVFFLTFSCEGTLKDSRIWKPSISGEFSAKAFYLALEVNQLPKASSSLVWLDLAPPQVETFCWLAVVAKISTADNLRRGLNMTNISNICMMCRKEESVNHLFLHCEIETGV